MEEQATPANAGRPFVHVDAQCSIMESAMEEPPTPMDADACRPFVHGRAPLQCCGFAFGLCGSASLAFRIRTCLILLGYSTSAVEWLRIVAFVLNVWTIFTLALLVFRYRSLTRLGKDLATYQHMSRICIFPLCVAFLSASIVGFHRELGLVFLHAGMVIQLQMMVRFLYIARQEGVKVEPLWFPATIGIAVGPAAAVSWEHDAASCQLWGVLFFAGLALASVLLPLCIWNVFSSVYRGPLVAPNPSIFVLQAPSAFLATIYISMYEQCGEIPLPRLGATLLVYCTIFVWMLTLYSVFVRRFELLKAPLHTWSALTFPSSSTASVLCLWHNNLKPDTPTLGVFAVVVGCLTLLIVASINLAFWVRVVGPAGLRRIGSEPAVRSLTSQASATSMVNRC